MRLSFLLSSYIPHKAERNFFEKKINFVKRNFQDSFTKFARKNIFFIVDTIAANFLVMRAKKSHQRICNFFIQCLFLCVLAIIYADVLRQIAKVKRN